MAKTALSMSNAGRDFNIDKMQLCLELKELTALN